MIDKIPLEDILFLDIETVPESDDFSKLDEVTQFLWEEKTRYQRKDDYTPEAFYEKAGIWAEFGKIICISVGYFNINRDQKNLELHLFMARKNKFC